MWLILARAPRPEMLVWPGRRGLALLDAVAWPAACLVLIVQAPMNPGVLGRLIVAVCVLLALQRGYRAIVHNQSYQFTTWRWALRLVALVAFGYWMQLAAMMLRH